MLISDSYIYACRMNHMEIESVTSCIHSEQECKILIDMAKAGRIGRVRRRLNENEKNKIRPGSVFIYNERESGIKRWTDKREWTPSRVQGIFLVYRDLNGPLFKKTYSSILPDSKYHIVSYSSIDWESNGKCCEIFKRKTMKEYKISSTEILNNARTYKLQGKGAFHVKNEPLAKRDACKGVPNIFQQRGTFEDLENSKFEGLQGSAFHYVENREFQSHQSKGYEEEAQTNSAKCGKYNINNLEGNFYNQINSSSKIKEDFLQSKRDEYQADFLSSKHNEYQEDCIQNYSSLEFKYPQEPYNKL
jgi:Gti1/Pac2 family